MRRITVLIVIGITVVLAGCMHILDTKREGIVSIVINPQQVSSTSAAPKFIPQTSEKIRIRIWNPETGFNTVTTASINTQQLSIAVPEGDGYNVGAVSYYIADSRPSALTGGAATRISVKADETTSIQLALRPWDTEISGDESAKPDESYSVQLVATDAGGLITRETFESASLHASTTSFQDPEDSLPSDPGTDGIVYDDHISLTATAPNVTEASTLYVAVLVRFTQTWTDRSHEDPEERTLFVELPNRHIDASLHQLLIDPSQGGISIVISSEDNER
jgi:hypothetical protein